MRLPVSLKPSPVGKVAPRGRMRGRFAAAIRLRATEAMAPLISQRAGPLQLPPRGKPCSKKAPLPSKNSAFTYCIEVSATRTASSRRISLRRFCRSARRSVGEVSTMPSSGGAAGSVNCKLSTQAPPLRSAPSPWRLCKTATSEQAQPARVEQAFCASIAPRSAGRRHRAAEPGLLSL